MVRVLKEMQETENKPFLVAENVIRFVIAFLKRHPKIVPAQAGTRSRRLRFLQDRSPDKIPAREKLILAGLYLSKYDQLGLNKLGFDSFLEAFNVIGYALGARPASIKNYRDEFDPLFPNPRKGWHKRETRDYCLAVLETHKGLDFETFTSLVASFFGYDLGSFQPTVPPIQEEEDESSSSFAQRLITGLAAEQYFESMQGEIPQFKGYLRENTTRFGCGYDFRLRSDADDKSYLAVEVKGIRDQTGSLLMTPKEYRAAETLKDRFFLFVVRNFRESPSHQIYQDPLNCPLEFRKIERVTIQVSWLTKI